MIFDTLHTDIVFDEGRLSIPAGTLGQLFGAPAAELLAGTSPALEIRDTQPLANDPARLTLRGKTAIAGLQLGPDTIVTASFEAVAAGGAELHATLCIECPERWRIDDSFPGRPRSGPEGEALVGSLHLQGASFTVSNAGAGTPAGTARITFDAQWQPQSALGVLASVAAQQTLKTTGDLVLPTSIGPVRRLKEGEFPWDLETRAAGLYLEATVGSIDLIPGSGEKASVGARACVPLWYDPASGRAPFEPMLGYVGALSIPNGGRFVLTARSWGAQDDELIVKAAFEAHDDSHHESALAHLMQGSSATELLPEPIRAAISRLEIADVAFHFTADPGGVRLATTSVGLAFTHAAKDAWSPVPGFAWPITLTRMRAVILHGAGAVPTRYFGTAEANLDVCGATLAVTVQAPDFSVMAVQTGGALDPAKLLDTCLPGLPRPPLPTVDRLSLTIEPGSYYACSVSIHPDHAWRIDTDHGQYRLPDVRVTVSNRGWQFEARVDEGERGVPVFALAAQLAGEIDGLRGLTLPPVLEGLTIDAVSLAYTSDTRDFFLECEGSLQLGEAHPGAPPAVRATFTAALTHDGGKVASQEFGGRLFVSAGSGEPLEFELDFESNGDASILLAGFHNAGGRPIRVVDLLANLPDTAALRTGVPESLAFALHDAVFVFERGSAGEAAKEPPPTRVLLGLDVELGLELSAPSLPGLPLIGQSSMTGEPLRLALQVTGANGTFTGADVAALKALGDAARFLPDTGVASGVNLNVAIRAGSEQKALNVPAGVHDVAGAPAIPSGPAPADAGAGASGTQWMDIHRSFGPLRVERVGVEYQHGRLTVLLDAGITIAGLTVSLDGLSASTALKPWEPTFGLRGLGIDYRNEAIEIGGAFLLHQVRTGETDAKGQPVEVPGFAGFAIVRAPALTLSASGLFVQLHDHPSLFLYAVLDYEFGGPPFFFVTGLAAGFGYNRAILLPEVEDLAAFPLIAQAKPALAARASAARAGRHGSFGRHDPRSDADAQRARALRAAGDRRELPRRGRPLQLIRHRRLLRPARRPAVAPVRDRSPRSVHRGVTEGRAWIARAHADHPGAARAQGDLRSRRGHPDGPGPADARLLPGGAAMSVERRFRLLLLVQGSRGRTRGRLRPHHRRLSPRVRSAGALSRGPTPAAAVEGERPPVDQGQRLLCAHGPCGDGRRAARGGVDRRGRGGVVHSRCRLPDLLATVLLRRQRLGGAARRRDDPRVRHAPPHVRGGSQRAPLGPGVLRHGQHLSPDPPLRRINQRGIRRSGFASGSAQLGFVPQRLPAEGPVRRRHRGRPGTDHRRAAGRVECRGAMDRRSGAVYVRGDVVDSADRRRSRPWATGRRPDGPDAEAARKRTRDPGRSCERQSVGAVYAGPDRQSDAGSIVGPGGRPGGARQALREGPARERQRTARRRTGRIHPEADGHRPCRREAAAVHGFEDRNGREARGNVRPPRVSLAAGRGRERDRAKCIVGGGVRRSSSAGAGKRRLRHRGNADRQCREHGRRCAERPGHAGVLGYSVPGSGFHRRTWRPSSLQQGASAITSGSSPT